MNKVVLMGNLARDPEVRYSQSAEPVAIARYSLAVNRRFKREGEPDADFISCVVFGRQAEFAEKYLKKGMKICISGSLRVSSWDDKQTGQKRWTTEVVVDEQDFAESKASFESRTGQNFQSPAPPQQKQDSGFGGDSFASIAQSIDDDDLPF